MENMRKNRLHFCREVGLSLLFALALCGTALAQQMQVSGTVTSVDGDRLRGVTVRVQGTDASTETDADGRYSVTAPANGVLVFTSIGYRAVAINVAGRTTIDVVLEPTVTLLDEVVVTGYSAQRRGDITGAVSSIDMQNVENQTSASVLQRLNGQVPGVTVDASGSPGSRSTVRIRGVSSFQNNDPLYLVDGTPVQESFINWLNPSDIESIQVLKDASAASIYGSRANNGVVIIETTKGRPGPARVRVDVRTGMASPVRGYDDFLILDALEYHEIVRRAHENAGEEVPTHVYGDPSNPTIPAYIWPNDGDNQTTSVDESSYAFPNNLIMPGSAGTNWWDAVFGPAMVSDFNLAVTGGATDYGYNVSFNYFNQEGTAAYNRFQRGTARVNTEFDLGRITIGENLAFSIEEQFGGVPGDPGGFAEGGILGKNILMQPVVPVYDISGENFASGKAVGLGNQTNPLKEAWANKDDISRNSRIIGNVFGGLALTDRLSFRTTLGFNLGEGSFKGYAPITPENSEPNFSDAINENYSVFTEWTWYNTLNYAGTFAGQHSIDVLLGQEAHAGTGRSIQASINNLLTTNIDARYIQDDIGDPDTKNVGTFGGRSAGLSFFGKVDYNFAEKYHLSATLRRDASSSFGEANRWGTFPAIGAGWRLSQESFLAGSDFFTNVMLRFGWGITGNENIPSGRGVSQFGGGLGDVFYAIGGGNTLTQGFRQTSLGNPDLKWEENQSVNVGLDLEFFGGDASLILDLYQRETDNLLFDPPQPATAGVAAPPIVNIGKMRNRGIEFALGYQGAIGDGTLWNVSFNGTHYKNEIVRIDGVQEFFFGPITTRFGNQVINQVGHPIGSFYGLVADGFFEDQGAVDAHVDQDGAAPGRIRFTDVNGDGQITLDDRTIIGSPHPDFTAGLDFGVRRGAWDFSATLFGTFGNEIFDVQKEFYVFRNFDTNVRRDLLTDSWTPENPDARYPQLDVNDATSRQLSSYYVEDGSYVRLRSVQLGYVLPASWIPGTRVFVQGENLFTITGYPGLDPSLPAASIGGPAGDIRDQYRGIDRGAYPSNKTVSFGISATF
jgi:TonB-linked SusC/RagA family outer membrane protein